MLYSYWHGYLDKPDWLEVQKQVKAVSGDFISAHTSGHIYIEDLIAFVKSIGAEKVVPVHTFEAAKFEEHFPNAVRASDGVSFLI